MADLHLDLTGLRLSYEGDDQELSWLDSALEQTVLRPSLCAQVLAPLAAAPLTCLPDPVPLALRTDRDEPSPHTDGVMVTDPTVWLDPDGESLTFALRRRPGPPVPAPSDLLPAGTDANAAVALSESIWTGRSRPCPAGSARRTSPRAPRKLTSRSGTYAVGCVASPDC